jgi:PAS domain S-box-containing protein
MDRIMSGEHQNGKVTGNAAQMEQALRASELRYRRLFETAKDGILILDADTGRVNDVNPFLIKLLGFTHDEMVGKTVGELSPFKDIVHNQAMLARLQKDGYIRYHDLPLETKEGRTVAVEFVSNMYSVGDAQVIQCNIREITDRKRAEEALRTSQLMLGDIINALPARVYWKDLNHIFLGCNTVFARDAGFAGPKDIIGKDDFQMGWHKQAEKYRGDDRQIMASACAKLLYEDPQTTPEGKLTTVLASKLPLRGAKGEIIGVLGTYLDITARKDAERELRLFRELIDHSSDGVEVVDPETGRLLDVNETTCQRLGYTREELLSMRVPDLGNVGVDFSNWGKHVEQVRQAGFINVEGEQKRKDGSTFPIEASIRYVKLERDYLLASVRDITVRKRAENALREQERLLTESQRLGHVGSWFSDMSGPVKWSEEMYHIYGVSPETFTPTVESLLGLIHPDDRPAMQRWLAACATGEKPAELEFRINRPDGTIRYIRGAGDAVKDAGNRVILMAGTGQDITERKLAEESHARLAMAVEQAAETIVVTDTSGTILYANPAFEKTSGYTRAAALGQNPRLLKSGKHDDEFYRRMWQVLGRGETWHGRFINKRKDGTLYEEDATISPVRNAAGTVVNYVAVKRDVTHEMQVESQLRQSQKMEAIGKLAGGVAHDFNNILAVIQMQAGLLKTDGDPTPEQLEFAIDIAKAAQRGSALTRQLLTFSRRQTLQLRDLDLNESINEMTKMLRRTLGENIEIQFKFAMQPLFIHADAGMMDQVLMNLAVNARDAMLKGGRLVIETAAVDFDESIIAKPAQARPGAFVCLSVSDTGSGIAPEILPRIFDPFFTTKEVGKGTGLGLATVFGIVQQHHGWINVYSEVGKGTTFRIYIPRLAKMTGQKPEQIALTAMRGGDETILLVEDDAFLRASVRKALSQLGYRILEAVNGVEALEIWKQHRDEIQLLLTDLVMPGGINGKELGEQLLKENAKLKVVYASGYSAEVIGQDFPVEEGVNFLTKPFEADKLAQTVRNRLDRTDVRKPDAARSAPGN